MRPPPRSGFARSGGSGGCRLGSRRDSDDLAFRAGAAEKLGDVLAHLVEGVAAELPRLIEVVDPFEADPLVADGKLGNLR